jgi:redox-sensitive bicupin YhaK (pirin superfamily)
MAAAAEVRRAMDRAITRSEWLESRHSFSFGPHYDPANTHFGLLVVSNDDVVAPGAGFGEHAHRDMEIVTWVLAGELAHRDSAGNAGSLRPGIVQRMSAGTGVTHAEVNASADDPVRFVQMWVLPDRPGGPPSYEQVDVDDHLASGVLVRVADGDGTGAVRIGQRAARLDVARLAPGDEVELPAAAYVHVYVPTGTLEIPGVALLSPGDAARLRGVERDRGVAVTDVEVLVWAMDRSVD